MTNLKRTAQPLAFGDAAVDGLVAGLIAGAAMALFLAAVQWFGGEMPWELLSRFSVGAAGSPLVGALLHLAVAGIYGIGFAVIIRFLPRGLVDGNRWVLIALGVLYGLMIFGLATTVLLPGAGSALRVIPPLTFALAHLLYGAVLGWRMASMA